MLNDWKKIVLLLVVLLMGCTSVKESRTFDDNAQRENTISESITDNPTYYMTSSAITGNAVMDTDTTAADDNKLSALINWKKVKVADIGFCPRFAESTVVQNDRYVFYPEEGNKIIRIEKSNGESQCIFELQDVKEGTGAQLCLAGNKLFVEYEGTIYRCSVDGSHVKKIADDTKERFASLIENCSQKDEGMIQGMKYYKGNLYLFTDYYSIVKLDLKNGEFVEIAKEVDSACFCGSALYCVDVYDQYLCKINLGTGKETVVRGKKKTGQEQKQYYDQIMVVDNQIYYTYYKKGCVPSLYKYNEKGDDEEIFTFQGSKSDFRVAQASGDRIIAEYDFHPNRQVQIYDIRSGKSTTASVPEDFETMAFMVDDVFFYNRKPLGDLYLSVFFLKE